MSTRVAIPAVVAAAVLGALVAGVLSARLDDGTGATIDQLSERARHRLARVDVVEQGGVGGLADVDHCPLWEGEGFMAVADGALWCTLVGRCRFSDHDGSLACRAEEDPGVRELPDLMFLAVSLGTSGGAENVATLTAEVTEDGRWRRESISAPAVGSYELGSECWEAEETNPDGSARRVCSAVFVQDDLFVGLVALNGERREWAAATLADQLPLVMERVAELDPSI